VPYSRGILHQTAPHHTQSPRIAPRAPSSRSDPDATRLAEERAAFRELHAARLHGFALILALGDRTRAARLAFDAIEAGAELHAELRHPERAAAWLRARVLAAYRPDRPSSPSVQAGRLAALEQIGIDDQRVAIALAALAPKDRAALVADQVERFDALDTATIVGRSGRRLARLIVHARLRYANAFAAQEPGSVGFGDGPLAERVRAIAARAMP
jgi:DNA-directed RNA polymerase specialized sigma24 family protein